MPPKRLPKQVYATNPPNCVLIEHLAQGLARVGPAIRSRNGYARFHNGFNGTVCRSALSLKAAITRWCNRLGIAPLNGVYFSTPKKRQGKS